LGLALDLPGYMQAFDERAKKIQRELAIKGHARMPHIVAELEAAEQLYLRFAVESGVIRADGLADILKECRNALFAAAKGNRVDSASHGPAARFVALLRSALLSGRALDQPGSLGWRKEESNSGDSWRPGGERIGYVDGNHSYLDLKLALPVVRRLGRESGDDFEISEFVLRKRLYEAHLLETTDINTARETHTVRHTVLGNQLPFLHFSIKTLTGEQSATGSPGHITAKTVSDGERKRRAQNLAPFTTVRAQSEKEVDKVWTPNQQRIVAHNWAKWERWRMQSPAAADQYRATHQDKTGSDLIWLLEFDHYEIPRSKNSWIIEPCRDKEERRLLVRVRDDAQAHPDKYGLGSCALCGEPAPWIAVFTTTQELVRVLDRAPDRKWVLVFGLCPLHRECGDAASQVEAQLMGESLFAGRGGVLVEAEAIASRHVTAYVNGRTRA
jgi:hypothetical protein